MLKDNATICDGMIWYDMIWYDMNFCIYGPATRIPQKQRRNRNGSHICATSMFNDASVKSRCTLNLGCLRAFIFTRPVIFRFSRQSFQWLSPSVWACNQLVSDCSSYGWVSWNGFQAFEINIVYFTLYGSIRIYVIFISKYVKPHSQCGIHPWVDLPNLLVCDLAVGRGASNL